MRIPVNLRIPGFALFAKMRILWILGFAELPKSWNLRILDSLYCESCDSKIHSTRKYANLRIRSSLECESRIRISANPVSNPRIPKSNITWYFCKHWQIQWVKVYYYYLSLRSPCLLFPKLRGLSQHIAPAQKSWAWLQITPCPLPFGLRRFCFLENEFYTPPPQWATLTKTISYRSFGRLTWLTQEARWCF